jgi:hypothetical protein
MPESPEGKEQDSRMEREIEEILAADDRTRVEPVTVAKPVAPRRVRSGRSPWAVTPEKLIVLGMVLLLIAAIGRAAVLPLTIAGILVAAAGYYSLVRRRRAQRNPYMVKRSTGGTADGPTQYWRGKPVSRVKARKLDEKVYEFPDTWRNRLRRKMGRRR